MAVTILGCGSSGGVPRVGQGWGACDPRDPRNRRRRCSALVSLRATVDGPATQVLIDTSPDLREQALDAGIEHLDAILMTHSHADHCHGIDDVRPLVLKAGRRIAMHMDAGTAARMRQGFDYIFATPPGSLYPPLLDDHRLEPGVAVAIEGRGGTLEALPIRVGHGEIDALSFRFGNIAYSPDVNAIDAEASAQLRDLDVWIVDALRYTPHPSHFSLDETLAHVARLRPRRTVLTNLHTDMDFADLAARLPEGVEPARDGMVITAG